MCIRDRVNPANGSSTFVASMCALIGSLCYAFNGNYLQKYHSNSNKKVLIGWSMLFGGLFSAYVFLRMAAPAGDFEYWGNKLSIPMATINTLVLISSSVTVIMAWASLKLKDFGKYKLYMGLTLLCSFMFLVIKYFEYEHKCHCCHLPGALYNPHIAPDCVAIEGNNPHVFFSIYFMMTGLHGIHVIAGMALIVWLIIRTIKGHFTPAYYTPVEMVGLFWHLVDLIWIFLFPLLYLIG